MISVVMPWRDSGEPYRKHNFEAVKKRWEAYADEVCVADCDEGMFNRSQAINRAYSKSKGDIIIIADADTLYCKPGLDEAVGVVQARYMQWALPYVRYYMTSPRWANYWLANQPELTEEGSIEHIGVLTSVSGIVITTREAFETVQGFDERFCGWGYEDNAFYNSLSTLCGHGFRSPSFVAHLWHPTADLNENISANFSLHMRYEAALGDPLMMRHVIKGRN